jgi:DNA repair protein RecO (recombination protein O)
MKIIEVEGLIIKDTNYSESSKIINIYTKELGLIGVMAKGARNIKSKLRSVTGQLVYGQFNLYYKEKGLSTLISVDVLNSFKNIILDIRKISYATYLLDLSSQVINQVHDNLFDLLLAALIKIDEGYDPGVITNIIEIKYLEHLGIKPEIDRCTLCGNQNNIITISSDAGGYICQDCYTNEYIVSDKCLKLIRMFYYVDISRISKLEVSNATQKELNTFISDYYDKFAGLYLKSKNFVNNINKLNII